MNNLGKFWVNSCDYVTKALSHTSANNTGVQFLLVTQQDTGNMFVI